MKLATPALVLLGAVSSAALGCESESSGAPPGVVSASIGPEGGALVGLDGVRVDVPPGALGVAVELTLRASAGAPAPAGAAFVSTPWTLEPVWLEFARPLTVTFPVAPASGAGAPIVVTTAQGTGGYLALAGTRVDVAHVAARTTHFATGGPVEASCPVTCTGSPDAGATSLRCASRCLGHAYVLTCAGPSGSTPCSCAIDGVVSDAVRVDTTDAGSGIGTYASVCAFPGG